MKKYWWVNHKQTYAQEVNGGYMWSPVRERDGKFSKFYHNMRLVRAGDFVISYAGGSVRALGTVLDRAVLGPRPEEFGMIGQNWADSGWLVPVEWKAVTPVRPKSMLKQIAPLLPSKYSPLRAETGDGNQKAYLAEISIELYRLVTAKAAATAPTPSEPLGYAAANLNEMIANVEEQQIRVDPNLSATEKEQLCKARRGQGRFRANLCLIESHCRLTLIRTQQLLVASHIKPWHVCETSHERLDGNNGLLLAPHADHLFDRGLISFDTEGMLIISSSLDRKDFERLRLPSVLSCIFNEGQKGYLEFHREMIFLD